MTSKTPDTSTVLRLVESTIARDKHNVNVISALCYLIHALLYYCQKYVDKDSKYSSYFAETESSLKRFQISIK